MKKIIGIIKFSMLAVCLITVKENLIYGFKNLSSIKLTVDIGSEEWKSKLDPYLEVQDKGEHSGKVKMPAGIYIDKVHLRQNKIKFVDIKFNYDDSSDYLFLKEARFKIESAVEKLLDIAKN